MALPMIAGAGILAARALAFRIALGAMRNTALKYTTAGYVGSEVMQAFTGEDQREVEEVTRTAIQQAYDIRDDNARNMSAETFALLADPNLRWPYHTRGDKAGEAHLPGYLVMNIQNGQSWVLPPGRYNSRKSVDAAFQRGVRTGMRRAERELRSRTQIYSGVSN